MKSCLAPAVLAFAAVRLAGAEVTCGSAESMAGLMTVWTAGFTAQHVDAAARVTVRSRYSADVFTALLQGQVEVAPFARELFPSETARGLQQFGSEPILVPVATGSRATKGGTHAIAIFVNEKNPLTHLSVEQLRKMLVRDGGITTWGGLGLGGEWAERKIVLHGMVRRRETGDPPGIVNFLESRVLASRAWRESILEHADTAGGPQALEQIVRAVAADETALGYSGFAYAVPGAKAVALGETEAGPFFSGTSEEVARGEYPLARKIYLCLRPVPDAVTCDFVRYVLSHTGQQAIVADREGFFPLPDPALIAARAQLH